MPNVTLRNATDTWSNGDATSRTYADATALHVRSADRFAWIFFNRAAPLGSTIRLGTLRLYYLSAQSVSRTLTVQRIAAPWKVSRLNHANRPSVTGSTVSVTAPAGPIGTVVEIDVAPLLQSVSDGAAWYGFRVSSSSTSNLPLGSAQARSPYRPTLEQSWVEKPDAPTTLSPSSGNAVATAKPTLRFDFTDNEGETALAAVQVQIDAAGDFTAPDWDSGIVATSTPSLVLSDPVHTYAGLANNASTFWRVRVQNAAGLWSSWSDDESFKRVDLGTVTITNPAAAPDDHVLETTPPILWTTSFTQSAYRVLIKSAADPATTIVDSGKTTSAEQSFTVPTMKLTGVGPYIVTVDAWDAVAREATPEAGDRAVATRSFTVAVDATVTPVSDLTVTQPNADLPRVVLTWTRSTAADSYVVARDGVTLEDDIAPEDVLVTGTSYEYVDETSQPWESHDWQVRAVVNAKQSSSSVVTLTPKTRGIWLLDEGRDRAVWLAGADGGSWARGEEASVFAPIGSTQIVRRVQSQRGYEGQLSGTLVDRHGRTAREHEADLTAMRSEPTRAVTLVLADMSLRVLLGNVTSYPLSEGVPPTRVASFDFWEVQ